MPARLVIEQGPRSGEFKDLESPLLVAGRDPDCGFYLRDSFISRRQFQISKLDGPNGPAYFLENLAHTNPTLLNGAEEPQRVSLEHDDVILAGATRVRFRTREPAPVESWIVGVSWQTERLREQVKKAGASSEPVLLRGEPGIGTHRVARAIHRESARTNEPFVTVDCTRLVDSLGDPPPAGTLFFDDVEELTAEGQERLLARISSGGQRIIAATNRDFPATYRHDLATRLMANAIEVGALCTRKDDIAEVARFLLERQGLGVTLTPAAFEKLRLHPWPDNVRELESVLERAIILCPATELDADTIHFAPVPAEEVTRERLERALAVTKHKKRAVASALGISRSLLTTHLERYGLE